MAAHPDLSAVCPVSPALEMTVGHLVVGDPADVPYDGRLVPVLGGDAYMVLLPPDGAGVLAVEGYAPVPITWSAGAEGEPARCSPDPIPLVGGEAFVSGHVVNAEGEPEGKVFVEGCGNQARTDASGSYAITVTPGSCVLQAFRRDGLLFASAEPAPLHVGPGDDLVVDFALPAIPKAGLGIVVRMTDAGVLVDEVLPGTAAEAYGLSAGDLVVEVAGVSTLEVELAEFVELAVGDEGTEVEIVVDRDGVTERMTLDRRVIEAP